LKHAHRVGGAQDRYRTRETDAPRACRRGREDDGGRGVQEVLPVVFSDSKDIEPDLIGELDLFDQFAQALRWGERPAVLRVCRGKTINADLNGSLQSIARSLRRAPFRRARRATGPPRLRSVDTCPRWVR